MKSSEDFRNNQQLRLISITELENIFDGNIFNTIYNQVSSITNVEKTDSANLPSLITLLRVFLSSLKSDGSLPSQTDFLNQLSLQIESQDVEESLFYKCCEALNFVIQNNLPSIDQNFALIHNFSWAPYQSKSQESKENEESLGSIMFNALFSSIENVDILGIDVIEKILPKLLNSIPENLKLGASIQTCENTENFLLKIGMSSYFDNDNIRNILIQILLKMAYSLQSAQFIYSILYLSLSSNIKFDISLVNQFFSKFKYTINYYDFDVDIQQKITKLFISKESIFALLDNLTICQISSNEIKTIAEIPYSVTYKHIVMTIRHIFFIDFIDKSTLKVAFMPTNRNDNTNNVNNNNNSNNENSNTNNLVISTYEINQKVKDLLYSWGNENVYCLFSSKKCQNGLILVEISFQNDKLNFCCFEEFNGPQNVDFGFHTSQNNFVLFSRSIENGLIYQISSQTVKFKMTCNPFYPERDVKFAGNLDMIALYDTNSHHMEVTRIQHPFLLKIDENANQLTKILQFVINQSLLRNLDDYIDLYSFFTTDPVRSISMLIQIIKLLIENQQTEMFEITLMALILNIQALSSTVKSSQNFQNDVTSLFNDLRVLLSKLLSSDICVKNPSILKIILILIVNHYSILFYPNYSQIGPFFKSIFLDEEKRKLIYKDNLVLLLFSTPIIVYIANNELINAVNNVKIPFLAYSSITRMPSMLQLEIKNLSNFGRIENSEKLMFDFLSAFFHYIFSQKNMQTLFIHLFIFTVRISHLKGGILLKSKFLELLQPHINELIDNFLLLPKVNESEEKYGTIQPHKYSRSMELKVYETLHPIPRRYDDSSLISFQDCDEILINFDPQCALDSTNSDFSISYTKKDGKPIKMKFQSDGSPTNFPRSIRIPSNECSIVVKSRGSNNFYGIKLQIFGECFIDEIKFNPYFFHFAFIFFFYTAGRCAVDCIKSFEHSKDELNCLQFAKEDLLPSEKNLSVRTSSSVQIKKQNIPNKTMTISDKPFFNRTSSSPNMSFVQLEKNVTIKRGNSKTNSWYSNDVQHSFLNALQSDIPLQSRNPASYFLKFMYKSIPFNYKFKEDKRILILEKQICSVLLYHTKTTSEAMRIGLISITSNENCHISIEISHLLHKVWKSLYSMRLYLYRLRQTNKDSFEDHLDQVTKKAKYLMTRNSILESDPDSAILTILSFLKFKMSMSEINKIADLRNKRIEMRSKSLNFFNNLIKMDSKLPISAKICLVSQIMFLFPDLMKDDDLYSVSPEIVKGFKSSFSIISKYLLHCITQFDLPLQLRSPIMRSLHFQFDSILSTFDLNEIFIRLIEFQKSHPDDLLHNSIWSMICKLALNPNIDINCFELLLFSNDDDTYKSLSLQSILIISRQLKIKSFDRLFHLLLPKASPSLTCAIYNIICQQIVQYGFDERFGVPKDFLTKMMMIIGSVYAGEPMYELLPKGTPASSLFWIATEFISLLRLCGKSFSKIRTKFVKLLSSIFDESLENILENDNKKFQLIAAFLVTGNDFCRLKTTDHAMTIDDALFPHYYFATCDYSRFQMRGYSVEESKMKISSSSPIPIARISTDSDLLILTENHCNLIRSLLSLKEYNILSVSFQSSLNILLQNQQNVETFLKFVGFDLLLKYSTCLSQRNINNSINHLCMDLIQLIMDQEIINSSKSNLSDTDSSFHLDNQNINEEEDTFVLLQGNGEVNTKEKTLKSNPKHLSSSSVFVLNSPLSCKSYFYEISGDNLESINVGFLSHRDTTKNYSKYIFNRSCGIITCESTTCLIGDIPEYSSISCGYLDNYIYFFIGMKYFKFGPYHFHYFTPFVEFKNDSQMTCSFNLDKSDYYISLLSNKELLPVSMEELSGSRNSLSTSELTLLLPSLLPPTTVDTTHHQHHHNNNQLHLLHSSMMLINHSQNNIRRNQRNSRHHNFMTRHFPSTESMSMNDDEEYEEEDEDIDLPPTPPPPLRRASSRSQPSSIKRNFNFNEIVDDDDDSEEEEEELNVNVNAENSQNNYFSNFSIGGNSSTMNNIDDEDDEEEDVEEEDDNSSHNSYMSDSSMPGVRIRSIGGFNFETETETDNDIVTGSGIGDENRSGYGNASGSRSKYSNDFQTPKIDNIFIGQYLRVDKKQAPILADRMKDEYWTSMNSKFDQQIGKVIKIEDNENNGNNQSSAFVLMRFFDQEIGKYVFLKIDSRFLVPVTTNPLETKIEQQSSIESVSENLSIRISRCTAMIVINKLLKEDKFVVYREFVILFSSYIREYIPFLVSTEPVLNFNNCAYFDIDKIEHEYLISEIKHRIIQNNKSYLSLLYSILKEVMNRIDFVKLMYENILTDFPHFTVDDLMKDIPNDLIYESTHPQSQQNVNMKFKYHGASGFILLVSPETDCGDSTFTIVGKNTYISFKKFDKTLNYSGLIKDSNLVISYKSVSSNNYGNKVALYPLKKFHNDFISNTASSVLHVIFTLIRISFLFTKDKMFLASFFSKRFIPMIFDNLLSNNFVIGSSYYELIVNLFRTLKFPQKYISLDLLDKFDRFWQIFRPVFDPSEPINICVQQILMIKIMLRKAEMSLDPSDIITDLPQVKSILINSPNIDGSIMRRSITRIFDSYMNASTKDDDFGDILSTFELCFALSCDHQFPHYILARDWIDQFATNLVFESKHPMREREVIIEIEAEYAKEVKITFDERTDLPSDAEIVAIDKKTMKTISKLKTDSETKVQQSTFLVKITIPRTRNHNETNKTMTANLNNSNETINYYDLIYIQNNNNQNNSNNYNNNLNDNNNNNNNLNDNNNNYNNLNDNNNNYKNVNDNDNSYACDDSFSDEFREDECEESYENVRSSCKSSEMKMWGFKIYVNTTSLTETGKKELFVKHRLQFFKDINIFENEWNSEIDEAILRLKLNENVNVTSNMKNPVIPASCYTLFPVLKDIEPRLLYLRSILLNRLNRKAAKLFTYSEVWRGFSPLSQLLVSSSSAISYSAKEEQFASILMKSGYQQRLEVTFNRSKATLAASDPGSPVGKSLLEQMIAQVPPESLSHLRQSDTPWKVKLLGEGATDAGGPGRDLFTQICLEIMQPYMKLFMKTNNRINRNDEDEDEDDEEKKTIFSDDYLVPNTEKMTNKKREMFHYVGALIGASYINKLPQPFRLMPLVWSFLVGRKISKFDIYKCDFKFKAKIESIRNIDNEKEYEELFSEQRYTVENALGETVELFSGGSKVKVSYEMKTSYCDMCEEFRINEFIEPLSIISEGLSIFIPTTLKKMLTAHELELLVCGDLKIPVSELKKHCRFEVNDPHVQMLWNVLDKFTSEERMLFVKFATGRMGLPPPGMKWSSPLCIRFDMFIEKSKADMRLPTASTCSSAISIPLYSSSEVMEKMIRVAITFGCDIERDHDMALDELVSIS